MQIEQHAQDSPSFVILWKKKHFILLFIKHIYYLFQLYIYIYIYKIQVSNIYIYECKTSIQRTHLFVGLSRNVYGFRVGHFSSQTNFSDLKSFLPNQINSPKCRLRSVTFVFAFLDESHGTVHDPDKFNKTYISG